MDSEIPIICNADAHGYILKLLALWMNGKQNNVEDWA